MSISDTRIFFAVCSPANKTGCLFARYSQSGFSLLELVTVLIIMAVLSAVAIPNFGNSFFEQRGFYDGLRATVQYAQRSAIASRRFTCVSIDATTGVVAVNRDPAIPEGKASISCSVPLALPAPDKRCAANNQLCAPSGVTLSASVNLNFDPQGRLVTVPGVLATPATIVVVSDANLSVSIEPETGYIL